MGVCNMFQGKSIPDRDPLETNPTCGRGSRVHRPSRTPSGTDDSGQDSGWAPRNIKPTHQTITKEKEGKCAVIACIKNNSTSFYLCSNN